MYLSNIAILKNKNVDYHCIITGISKSEAIKLLQNIDLTEKSEALYKIKWTINYKICWYWNQKTKISVT